MFVIGYTGCDPAAPAALYTAALALTSATPAGVFASAADIAPNFAGTVFGLCQTVGAAGLLAANYVVSEGLHGSVRILQYFISVATEARITCFITTTHSYSSVHIKALILIRHFFNMYFKTQIKINVLNLRYYVSQ